MLVESFGDLQDFLDIGLGREIVSVQDDAIGKLKVMTLPSHTKVILVLRILNSVSHLDTSPWIEEFGAETQELGTRVH